MNNDKTVDSFEAWGLLELFGHQRLAGKLSDQTIGGVHFLRIDVPAVDDVPPYTRFFTQGAIYGMTVTTEDVARRLAGTLQARPVSAYELRETAPALLTPPRPVDETAVAPESSPAAAVECCEVYEGTVTRLLDFGALVEILDGIEGLLHISQIAHNRVDNVADFLAVGQVVTVKVIETDEKGRIKLSMKALLSKPVTADTDDDWPF
jgi:hypothetical protein